MSTLSKEEVAARARTLYEQKIRPLVEPGNIGKYLVMDVNTGAYEIDHDDVVVMERAATRFPAGTLYGMRIGYRSMGRIGSHARAQA
jgi:hypothetical protein